MNKYKISIRGRGSKVMQGNSAVEVFSKLFPDMSLQTTHGNDTVANVSIELLGAPTKTVSYYIATNTVQKQIYTEDTKEFASLIKKRKEVEAKKKAEEEEKKRIEEEKRRQEEERIRLEGEIFRGALEVEYCSRVRKLLNMLTLMKEQDAEIFDKVFEECLSNKAGFHLEIDGVPTDKWAFQYGEKGEGVTFTRTNLDVSDRKYLSCLMFDWIPFERNLFAGFGKYYGEGVVIPNLNTLMPTDGAFYAFGALKSTDSGQFCFLLRRYALDDGRTCINDLEEKDKNSFRGKGYFEFDAEGEFTKQGVYAYDTFAKAVQEYRRMESQIQHWQNRYKSYKTGLIRCTQAGAGFATVGFILEEDFDTF